MLTALGGMTSHAAVVARGMGKCCVSGCTAAEVDSKAKTLKVPAVLLCLLVVVVTMMGVSQLNSGRTRRKGVSQTCVIPRFSSAILYGAHGGSFLRVDRVCSEEQSLCRRWGSRLAKNGMVHVFAVDRPDVGHVLLASPKG